jgi:hypothetical protein
MNEIRFDLMSEDEFISTIIYDSKHGINRDYKTCLEKMQSHFRVMEILKTYCWGGMFLQEFYIKKKRDEIFQHEVQTGQRPYSCRNRGNVLIRNDADIVYRPTVEDQMIMNIALNNLRTMLSYHQEIYSEEKYHQQYEINYAWREEQKQLDEERQEELQVQREENKRIKLEIEKRKQENAALEAIVRETRREERQKRILKRKIQLELEEQERLERKKKEEEKQKQRKKENKERKKLRDIERKNNSEAPRCTVCFSKRNLVDGNCGCSAEYCVKCLQKINYECCICRQSFID